MQLDSPADYFVWATGIEDTFVPQARPGHRALDEYQLMGHYTRWREDLALTRELGLQAVRWGVPWYRVEPEPGRFDWSWTDQVLPYIVEELGIVPIMDLMHYGCPLWLPRAFADPAYPTLVAAYARAFAKRYARLVRWYTPLNEPHMTALMCGRRGLWPPYLRGDRGYIRVMVQLTRGVIHTVEAIKEVVPDAVVVHVEATALHRSARDDLESLAIEERERRFLYYDLLHGRVTPDHPIFPWLMRNGARPDELEEIVRRPVPFDIMGLNFYPQWSTHQLYVTRRGRVALRSCEQDGAGFTELIDLHYRRYGMPLMVTETSAYGQDDVRSAWLGASVAAIKELRGRNVPLIGYTWFPLFTMIDWRYRYGQAPAERYRIDLGLYTLNGSGSGPRWHATSLVEQFRGYARNSPGAVGPLAAGHTLPV